VALEEMVKGGNVGFGDVDGLALNQASGVLALDVGGEGGAAGKQP
jgi:hypothetical protein